MQTDLIHMEGNTEVGGKKQQNYKETKVFSREIMLEDAMKYLLPSSGLIFPFSLL